MRVVITGAAGQIGREIVDELSDSYELCLIDRKPVSGHSSIIANLGHYENHTKSSLIKAGWLRTHRWWEAFEGADIVIHLAEDPDCDASWAQILQGNLRVTWSVLQIAAEHRVRRVIYASSGWAVKNLELELAPACYLPDGPKIGSEVQPHPKNPYGIAKALGEMMGQALVDDGKLDSFVAIRIGWYDPIHPKDNTYGRLGITVDDLRSLFRRCVEAEFKGFHVVYGVSAQRTSPYDLSHTRHLLSWEPRQVPSEQS